MVATDLNQTAAHDHVGLGYEHSWLHRHCPSNLIHHKRARGSGRLFSGLLAMNVIFLGAALISSVILSSMPVQNSHIFLSVLMLCSSGWILFYLLWTRRKPFSVELHDHQAGAFWLRASLLLFGTCSLLVAIFKIGYDASLLTCKQPMDMVFSLVEIIFISIQTFFLWLSCQDCVQVQHDITRYGIMLSLATNLLLWLMAVINDSEHREMESLQPNSTSADNTDCICLERPMCWSFQKGYVTLFPFNLEYSLVCASMLYIMWRNVGRKDISSSAFSHPRFRLQGVLYGPILGGAALLVGFCIFIQYQVQAASGVPAPMSYILYYIYIVILLAIMLISCIIGIIAQTFKEKQLVGQPEKQSEQDENKNDSDRATKQENKNQCRHRHMEKNKDYEQKEVDTLEHKEQKGDYECMDQEENVEITEYQKESCEKCDIQTESGKYSEIIPIEDMVKDEGADHMDPNHHYRTTNKKRSAQASQEFAMGAGQKSKNYTRSLDIVLLLAAALGQFCISYYSIVAIVAKSTWNLLNSLNLSHSALMILQHMSQNIFIIEGMRKEAHRPIHSTAQEERKEEAPRRMSLLEIRRVSLAYLQSVGRLSISRRLVKEIALFLVLCNIMIWIMSAFGDHPQYTNGLERDFYGSSAWFSILNFGLPLSVFYRMHSVGGLLEVYLTA